MIRHHNSDSAGSSHCPLQPKVHQKLHLPQQNTELSVPHSGGSSSSCRNNSIPVPVHCEANLQSTQHSVRARLVNSKLSHSESSQLSESRHSRSPLTNPLCNTKTHTKHPHKPPQPAHLYGEELKMWVCNNNLIFFFTFIYSQNKEIKVYVNLYYYIMFYLLFGCIEMDYCRPHWTSRAIPKWMKCKSVEKMASVLMGFQRGWTKPPWAMDTFIFLMVP